MTLKKRVGPFTEMYIHLEVQTKSLKFGKYVGSTSLDKMARISVCVHAGLIVMFTRKLLAVMSNMILLFLFSCACHDVCSSLLFYFEV